MKTNARTLTIRFGDIDADYREFASVWAALESGGSASESVHALTFESLAGFLSCLTKKRWTLLQRLRQCGPTSIRRLATELGRDYKNVHTDIQRLAELDLVARDAHGLVYVPWDEIDARIALAA